MNNNVATVRLWCWLMFILALVSLWVINEGFESVRDGQDAIVEGQQDLLEVQRMRLEIQMYEDAAEGKEEVDIESMKWIYL